VPQMVLASRLADGRVVFLGPGNGWVDTIAAGAVAADADTAARLLAAAKADESRNLVVDPYLVDITEENGRRRPVVWREAIRAEGPTVRTDLPPEEAAAALHRQKTGPTQARSGRKFSE
jgi:hypothetical protein